MRSVSAVVGVMVFAGGVSAQHLQEVCGGLTQPVDMAFDPAPAAIDTESREMPVSQRVFIVEQKTGNIRVIEDGTLRDEPALTMPKDTFTIKGWEQGMLGVALAPDFATSRHMFMNYSGPYGETIVSRFTFSDENTIDLASELVILKIRQPYGNHNGGCIRFGPDGMLYIGMGDGGLANDPKGNAQNLTSLLGKMLRIDVSRSSVETPYAIPRGNPFAVRDDAQPEIWAFGVRNPWRFEFDSHGRIWIADVGQNVREWIHLQPADSKGGENYGWNYMEGEEKFTKRPKDQQEIIPEPGTVTLPIWSYTHKDNNNQNGSITGGYFYEADGVPALKNRYIFADFMSGRVWSFRIRGEGENARADDVVEHTDAFKPAFGDTGMNLSISSFGKDPAGELYLFDHKTGRLFKIVE
ncbi:MAG: PQQ-dependent sugar dehydrogenase [Phycisphaeraceae bacterium]|nr:PQQ-dependent sugar dehydrogenase [Phycisphaerales bacterium]MCB9858999.1 PQQ-dependent sugar dehydrogenase [Phycisphaeraceae bacterium]